MATARDKDAGGWTHSPDSRAEQEEPQASGHTQTLWPWQQATEFGGFSYLFLTAGGQGPGLSVVAVVLRLFVLLPAGSQDSPLWFYGPVAGAGAREKNGHTRAPRKVSFDLGSKPECTVERWAGPGPALC